MSDGPQYESPVPPIRVTRVQEHPPLWQARKPGRPIAHANTAESAWGWSLDERNDLFLHPLVVAVELREKGECSIAEIAQQVADAVVGVLGAVGAEAWVVEEADTLALGVFWPIGALPDPEHAITGVLHAIRAAGIPVVSRPIVAAHVYEATVRRAGIGRVSWRDSSA